MVLETKVLELWEIRKKVLVPGGDVGFCKGFLYVLDLDPGYIVQDMQHIVPALALDPLDLQVLSRVIIAHNIFFKNLQILSYISYNYLTKFIDKNLLSQSHTII